MKKKIKCKARLRTVGCKIYGRSHVEHNHLPEPVTDFSQVEADPLDQLDQYTYNDPGNTYLQILMMTLKLLISNMSKM